MRPGFVGVVRPQGPRILIAAILILMDLTFTKASDSALSTAERKLAAHEIRPTHSDMAGPLPSAGAGTLTGETASAIVDPPPVLTKPAGDPLWQVPDADAPVAELHSATGASDVAFSLETSAAAALANLRQVARERTALHGALGSGDTFTGGLGGLTGTVASPLLPQTDPQVGGFHFGPVLAHVSFGLGALATRQRSSSPEGDYSETVGNGTLSVNAQLGEGGHTLNLQETSTVSPGARNSSNYTQSLSLTGSYLFTKLTVGFNFALDDLSGISRDAGGDASRDLATLGLNSKYELDSKFTTNWDLSFPVRRFAGKISSAGVTSTNGLDYIVDPKTTIGVSFSAGTLAVEQSSTQVFEQLSLKGTYESTEKLHFHGEFGAEYRTFGGQHAVNPIFGFGVIWQPFVRTTLTLTGSRGIFNSAEEQNTNFSSTTFQFSAAQQIGARFTATASISYEIANYSAAGASNVGSPDLSAEAASRRDRLIVAQFTLATRLTERATLTLVVAEGNNTSNQDSFHYLQGSLQTSLSF